MRHLKRNKKLIPRKGWYRNKTTVETVEIPTGKVLSAVRMYADHDINGTTPFTSPEDLDSFYWAGFDQQDNPCIVNLDEEALTLDSGRDFSGNDLRLRPPGMEYDFNQFMDNTPIEIQCPYFKVFNEAVYYMIEVHFNWGEDKGGGSNYARFRVIPNISHGSPNQNRLLFRLHYRNYGVWQGSEQEVYDFRKYPDHNGTDVSYRIRFYIDEDTDQVKVKVLGDYSGASEQTLTKSSPPGVDYCDMHRWKIASFFGDPDESSTARTAISHLKILKGDDEGNRIIYKLSRDGGANWAQKIGDSWFTDGHNKTDIDLSSQGSGDRELLMRIEMKWPGIVKGLGLAWKG